MNLNSQINLGLSLSGRPNILKNPDARQQYSLVADIGYNYELTDRLVASLNNTFNLVFLNYNKQQKTLINNLGFSLNYFIEYNLSLNANYQWSYEVYKNNYYENPTNNNHSINLGFTFRGSGYQSNPDQLYYVFNE
jgi:hypothetical protein